MRHFLILAGMLFACVSQTAFSQTFKDGDKVMVKVREAKLSEGDKGANTRVYVGDIFTITKIDGDRMWIGCGWIDKANVVPLDQAVTYFTEQIKKQPNGFNHFGRAFAYEAAGELDKAIADESEALQLDAGQPAWLAVIYNNRGNFRLDKGEYDLAIADYNEAIYNDHYYAIAYDNRGLALYKKKQCDTAVSDFDEAIRLDPNFELSYLRRADVNFLRGKYAEGLADLQSALQIDPDDSYAYNERAWFCATCTDAKFRDGAKAVELATKACELNNWQFADYVNTLAAAYAEKGDFDLAIKWENKALELKLAPNTTWKPEDLRAQLELYKSGKPYRDELKEN